MIVQEETTQQKCWEAMGKLIPGLVHELNNPIGSIRNNLESTSGYIDEIQNFFNAIESMLKGSEFESKFKQTAEDLDVAFLFEDSKDANSESSRGITRLSNLSKSMQSQFSGGEKIEESIPLQKHISQTLELLHNVLKYSIDLKYTPGEEIYITGSMRDLDFVIFSTILIVAESINRSGDLSIVIDRSDPQTTITVAGVPSDPNQDATEHLNGCDHTAQVARSNNWNLTQTETGYEIHFSN